MIYLGMEIDQLLNGAWGDYRMLTTLPKPGLTTNEPN